MRRSNLLLVPLALLAACGSPPMSRTPVPPSSVSAERIDRLLATLDAEWHRWGAMTAELPAGDTFCLDFPDGTCREVDDGCGQEQTADLCAVVDEYWQAVDPSQPPLPCRRTDVCEATWPFPDEPAEITPAWSAAFVSAMMARAGFTRDEFPRDINHAGFVVAFRDGFASAYEVVPAPTMVLPGDLACAVRGASAVLPPPIASIAGGRSSPPMHCDVVVRVDLAAGIAEAIGGNVQQTVAKTRIALDRDGRISAEVNSTRLWLLVLRARREMAVSGQREHGGEKKRGPPGERHPHRRGVEEEETSAS